MQVRRFWVSGAVFAVAMALLPFSFNSGRHLEAATRVEGSQAETVRQELATRFRSPFVDRVAVVVQGLPPADSAEGGQALQTIEEALKEQSGVSGVVSYLDLRDPIFLGRGGGTFVLVGLESTEGPVEALVPNLHRIAASLEDRLRGRYPAAKLELTGEIPLNFDIRQTSSEDVRRGESLVIPATLVLLLVSFGSLVAAFIPLAIGQLAIATTLAITGFLAQRWHLSILVQNLATMLGLGLGIDYALLMISRFREAVSAGNSGPTASVIAARRAGRTLLISASTVAIGFLALLTVPISEIRSIGIAGFLVAAISVLLTNTLVPAVLALLGSRIDLGRMPFTPKLDVQRVARTGNRWRRWGTVIVAHPWPALFLAGTPLLLLGWQAGRLDTRVPTVDWLPQKAESVRALHALEKMDRSGVVESLRMIVELPKDSITQTDAGWNAIDRLSKRLASDPRCYRVISITTLAEGNRDSVGSLSRETHRTFVSSDGHAALLEVVPKSSVSLRDQVDWVRQLRKIGGPALTGVPDATLLIGGIPALNADYETIVRNRFLPVTTLVVVVTFLALLAGFRSVFAAVKAIALNLLSVAASFGALVLVFQYGYGSRFLGVPGGTGSVFPLVPIVAFAIVFGLSMDYEVFLVARVLEARRNGLSETDAIPEGMARTAGLITSAAAIMIVVFLAFTVGDFLVVKMIGFTLAVAVLIDATLVRIVIGPALLRLAGDWNWWPGGLTTRRESSTAAGPKCFVLFLVFGVLLAHVASAQTSPTNPIVPGDHPDPTIIRVGDSYWTASTSGDWAPEFPLFRSTDLRHWTAAGVIFPQSPSWASGSFWAPELVNDRGRILVYYVGRKRGGPLCVAAATADRPEGPYADRGPLVCQTDGSIDPAMARDERGHPFLVWKEDGNSIGRPTPIWAQPLTDDLIHVTGTPTQLIVNDPATWEGGVVEAPYIMRHDGHFYLFYAGNACCGAACRYAEGVARAEHLLGPWTKDPANPIIRPNSNWRCPGHGTAVETASGEDYFLYHAYPAAGTVYLGRESVLDQITWSDGWPIINGGTGPSGGSADVNTKEPTFTDNFSEPSLDAGWQWPVRRAPRWTIGQGALTLEASDDNRPVFVARRLVAPNYDATVGVGGTGGLGIIGGAHSMLVLSQRADRLEIWRLSDAGRQVLWQFEVAKSSIVWLRAVSADLSNTSFSYSLDHKHWMHAGPPLSVTELLPWDQGLRVGLVNADGTAAHFTQFSLAGQEIP